MTAVRFDGTVVTWGGNERQQLGHAAPSGGCSAPGSADRIVVRPIAGFTGVASVSGGHQHFLARKTDGSVWARGANSDGQLGDDTTQDTGLPGQVVGLTEAVLVSAGADHSLAVTADGSVWAWGANHRGQLGVTGGDPTHAGAGHISRS